MPEYDVIIFYKNGETATVKKVKKVFINKDNEKLEIFLNLEYNTSGSYICFNLNSIAGYFINVDVNSNIVRYINGNIG